MWRHLLWAAVAAVLVLLWIVWRWPRPTAQATRPSENSLEEDRLSVVRSLD
jgi:hypothetical protein